MTINMITINTMKTAAIASAMKILFIDFFGGGVVVLVAVVVVAVTPLPAGETTVVVAEVGWGEELTGAVAISSFV
jgi:hypothetical protein